MQIMKREWKKRATFVKSAMMDEGIHEMNVIQMPCMYFYFYIQRIYNYIGYT